jgi:hypothetical protein
MNIIPDTRFRDGSLLLAATSFGSVLLAWFLAAMLMEAVTLPDNEGIAVVSLLSGLALLSFGAVLLPLGLSLKLVGGGLLRPFGVVPITIPTAWQTRLRIGA